MSTFFAVNHAQLSDDLAIALPNYRIANMARPVWSRKTNQVKDTNVAIKTETFFMETEGDATLFLDSCLADGFEAKLLPPEEQDGRVYYPVKVTFDTTQLAKKGK